MSTAGYSEGTKPANIRSMWAVITGSLRSPENRKESAVSKGRLILHALECDFEILVFRDHSTAISTQSASHQACVPISRLHFCAKVFMVPLSMFTVGNRDLSSLLPKYALLPDISWPITPVVYSEPVHRMITPNVIENAVNLRFFALDE